MFAETGCVFMAFILYISGVYGPAPLPNPYYKEVISICALKGSAVDLPCSQKHPTSSKKWYTLHRIDTTYIFNELYADGKKVIYNMSEESSFTLTINTLNESDAKSYCCKENTDDQQCYQLHVADLQVKVIPATEDQRVTLMCSTSCPLTEKPAAYIWYKNREFLYEDWSPWYQELVSSEEGVKYSCAIKGYEDLRAPEVSVDSVTSTCFTVTYAKGRMCSYQQKSEDEPCSITYPREVHVQKTPERNYIMLTCNSICLMVDPQTAYRWYWSRKIFSNCESQDMITFNSDYETISCAVKGHEDLLSDEICTGNKLCGSVNYARRRICALEGSSVNISSEYSRFYAISNTWYKIKRHGEVKAERLTEDAAKVEFYDNTKDQHSLIINNLTKTDSAEYAFMHTQTLENWTSFLLPGVILIVTGLKVTMAPSAEVTEGQRVTLTCSTSCHLTDNINYNWYLNSQPLTLPESPNKHLVLDPVSIQHAGNYSCVVTTTQNISSTEENLTVKARGKSVLIMNAVRLTLLSLPLLSATFMLYLWMRKKTLTSTTEPSDKVQAGQMELLYESIPLTPMNPAAQAEPEEQQEDTV